MAIEDGLVDWGYVSPMSWLFFFPEALSQPAFWAVATYLPACGLECWLSSFSKEENIHYRRQGLQPVISQVLSFLFCSFFKTLLNWSTHVKSRQTQPHTLILVRHLARSGMELKATAMPPNCFHSSRHVDSALVSVMFSVLHTAQQLRLILSPVLSLV